MGNYSNKEGYINNERRKNIIDRAYVLCEDVKVATKPDISKLMVKDNKYCESSNKSFDDSKGIKSDCLKKNLYDIINTDLSIVNEDDLKKIMNNSSNLDDYLDKQCAGVPLTAYMGENFQVASCDYRYPLELNNKLKCEIEELSKLSEKINETPKQYNLKYLGIMGAIILVLLIFIFLIIYFN